MNLLLVTQKVDVDDPVLGFFHRWILEFAKQYEKVTVICLFEGEHTLPDNVKVLSLGKESGASQVKYILRFYKYIWHERNNYDAVFVHMNQIYVLLGWKIWRFFNKRVFLWYNHKKGTLSTRLAVFLSHNVFYTSPFAFTARFKKSIKMPVGIDTNYFSPNDSVQKKEHSLLSLGRISKVKNIDVFVNALHILYKKGINFRAFIYGTGSTQDNKYEEKIRTISKDLEEAGRLTFLDAVPNNETPQIYSEHEIFVNATGEGSFDKTILEAMACGTVVLTCNTSLQNVLGKEFIFREGDSNDLAEKLESALSHLGDLEMLRNDIRNYVVEEHDIKVLVQNVGSYLEI